jgi:XisI protein
MDKLTYYPELIKQILTDYIELTNLHSHLDLEQFLIVDEAKANYIWMNLG